MTNPIIQGLLTNFISSGVQEGGKRLFSDNLSQQFEIAILDAFDKLSEKYPIRNFQKDYTFWDYVAKKITDELALKDFSEEKIKVAIKSVLEELLIDKNNKYEIDHMNDYFWHLFQCEIILHKELYKYLLFTYHQDIKKSLVSVTGKLDSIMYKKESNISEEELVDYLISLQQVYIKEIGNDFIPRSFENKNVVERSLFKIDQILRERSNNVLLLGEPGSGKTIVTKRMLYELTSQNNSEFNDKIPVFINLAMFGHSFTTISDGVVQALERYMSNINKELVDHLLKQGKFIILLDGLDEVRQEFYEVCINELKEIMQHKNENKFILTCRNNIYLDELNFLVEPVRLLPLTREEIEKFISQYSDIPLHQLTNEHYELFGNPLLLNISLEVINNNGGKLPKNRSSIFNKYIEYLSYKWERKKGLKREYILSYYEVVDFLSNLAFEKYEKPFITTLELQEEISSQFPRESVQFIFEQIINIGVFVYTHHEEQISYSHKTFKEYFAGKAITNKIEKERDYEFLNGFINKKEWYEVFIFAAGLFDSWDSQSDYLEYILDNNLKLYVDCVSAKNDFNEYLLSLSVEEYSNIYLRTLVCNYETIIDKYFSQIKHQLNPYLGLNGDLDKLTICILGQLSEDKKHLYFTFIAEENNQEKVRFMEPKEFNEYRKRKGRIIDNYVNLELSNLMGDSVRKVALDQLKSQLSNVFKEYRLNENSLLLCERVKEMIRSLPVSDTSDLHIIYQWLKEKIESAQEHMGNDGVFVGYNYNGVELTSLYKYVKSLINGQVEYEKSSLPTQDLVLNRGGGIWEFYSRERLLERTELFFEYYQKSFIYLVQNNFNALKEYLPDYVHLPYKYIIEIEFDDGAEAKSRPETEPLMSYYYIATSSFEDTKPNIKIVEKRSSWEEQEVNIKKSFRNKQRFTNDFRVHSTGVTMTMFERSGGKGIPLLSNTYNLVKSNLEYIFGKFR